MANLDSARLSQESILVDKPKHHIEVYIGHIGIMEKASMKGLEKGLLKLN